MTSKYSKCLLPLFLGAMAIVVLLSYLFFFREGYYSSFAIAYTSYDYPLITIELPNKKCELALRIGSRFPLFLRKETLNEIDKQPQGIAESHGINGINHEAPTYLITKLTVGDLELKNIVAYESDRDEYGILGKFLGGEFNLLVDFPHSRIIACDTFNKLKTKKLVDINWVRVPFEVGPIGIVFNVDTDFGMRKFAINTTSTLSHFRSSVIPSDQPAVSSSLILGGQKFGNLSFNAIDLPEGLNEIDGFIGMDFLKEHGIYFDYSHKIAYIEPLREYFERIPVTFNNCMNPIIDVSIQDRTYPFKLDLGISVPFSAREDILQNIYKDKYGTYKWYDFRGARYESPLYTIPEIKIGGLTFSRVLAKQDNEDFNINVTLKGPPLYSPGVIGLPILEKYNLFLDFSHAAVYASNDSLSLQKRGLLSQNLLAIPFTLHRDGIILSINTDVGTYRLILDTGATGTLIRAPHPTSTEQFRIMGHDFGKRSVMPFDLFPECTFDGLLGMDFLREYPLFIDYVNKIIFIDLQKND